MDTITANDASLSRRSGVYCVVTLGLAGVLVAPGLVAPTYARIVTYALLAFCVALTSRFTAVAIVAWWRHSPPVRPADETLPTVSVVITAYNEADVLPATIEACTALNYPDDALEIVVGYESASTDGTAAVAEAIADSNPRVTSVERAAPPGGKASATNHALSHATGEVIAVLDADQRLEPDALRRAVRWFRDDDIWCVKGRCYGTNADASLVALCATVERGIVERTEFFARDLLGGFALFTGGQAFFRAAALARVGTFDESILLEDLDMAYRLQRAGGTVRVDPGIVTRETNPAEISAWWNQRKRWARGGMQIARRYLGTNLLSGPPSLLARVDFAVTLCSLLALTPLVLSSPLAGIVLWKGTHALGELPLLVLTSVIAAPFAVVYATFALDARDGYRHSGREYLAPVLLWPYFVVQVGAVVASFLDEFVLRQPAVYVTSSTDDSEA